MKVASFNKSIRIVHVAFDSIFINIAYNSFEQVYPKCNDVFIFTKKPWVYIKKNDVFIEKKKSELLTISFFSSLKKYDVIVLHSLANFMIPLVLMSKNKKVIWLGMGYDYYSRTFSSDTLDVGLYLEKTKKLIMEDASSAVTKCSVKSYLTRKVNSVLGSEFLFKLALSRIDVFSPALPIEYDMLKNKFNVKSFPAYSPWNYGNLEKDLIRNLMGKEISGGWILLGNSASHTNNHIEAIDILSKLDLSSLNYKIVTPLSYGDKCYADKIKDYGKDKFGDDFYPIEEFMSIDRYTELLQQCGFVIMNHVRQQAMGNIIIMMYLGAKIFLRPESATYKFFKSLGAIIYSIEDLRENKNLIVTKLEFHEVIKNKKILSSYFSEDADFKKTKSLIELTMYHSENNNFK